MSIADGLARMRNKQRDPGGRKSDKDTESNPYSGDPDQARLNREWEERQQRIRDNQSTDSSQ